MLDTITVSTVDWWANISRQGPFWKSDFLGVVAMCKWWGSSDNPVWDLTLPWRGDWQWQLGFWQPWVARRGYFRRGMWDCQIIGDHIYATCTWILPAAGIHFLACHIQWTRCTDYFIARLPFYIEAGPFYHGSWQTVRCYFLVQGLYSVLFFCSWKFL